MPGARVRVFVLDIFPGDAKTEITRRRIQSANDTIHFVLNENPYSAKTV